MSEVGTIKTSKAMKMPKSRALLSKETSRDNLKSG
jgi:hypothetical protein